MIGLLCLILIYYLCTMYVLVHSVVMIVLMFGAPLYLTGNVSYRSNNWTIPNFIHKIFSLKANSEITLMLSVEHVAFNVYFESLKQYFLIFKHGKKKFMIKREGKRDRGRRKMEKGRRKDSSKLKCG